MGASPATAKTKTCSRCKEPKLLSEFCKRSANKTSGLDPRCKLCRNTTHKATYKSRKVCKIRIVHLFCAYCEKPIEILRHRYVGKWAGRQTFYCSKSCGGFAHAGHAQGGPEIKRQHGWSDEQLFWERKLSKLGLGMSRGISGFLIYGHDYAIVTNTESLGDKFST
jgi:hypothetical protein